MTWIVLLNEQFMDEVELALKHAKVDKAACLDGLSNKTFKINFSIFLSQFIYTV